MTTKSLPKYIKVKGQVYRLADAPKKMYIMRGVSGSGKSTKAKQLAGSGKVFSTDDFFMEGEEYNFNPTKLQEAHKWNQKRVWDAAHKGITPIVVDNTTTQGWEAKPYVVIGMTEGYDVEIVEPESPWWNKFRPNMSEEELQELAETLVSKTVHGVPIEGIKNMLKRWEFDLDPMKILRSERPVWKPRRGAVSFNRLTKDAYGQSVRSLYRELVGIGLSTLAGVDVPDLQVFVDVRIGMRASDSFIYKKYKRVEDLVNHWAVTQNYLSDSRSSRTVDTVTDDINSIDTVYSTIEGNPVAYLGITKLGGLPGGFSPIVAIHTVPTDSANILSDIPAQSKTIQDYRKERPKKFRLPGVPSSYGGRSVSKEWVTRTQKNTTDQSRYMKHKNKASIQSTKEKTTMAKENTPPKVIRVGGVLYKLAAPGAAIQNEMMTLQNAVKQLSDNKGLDGSAKDSLKRDAIDSLTELGSLIKAM